VGRSCVHRMGIESGSKLPQSKRMSSHFELTPVKLVYGGEALGHYAGRTVLAPRILPGERALVEEVRTAKGVVHARPLRILQAAPERAVPPCPYFGRCGGCQYQHLDAGRQAAVKREILRETLRRLGKIYWQGEIPMHSGPPWNYRNQARMKVASQPDGKVALGFCEAESTRVFPVDACPILSPRLNAILKELAGSDWLPRLRACREIELLADERDEQVMLTLHGGLASEEGEGLARDSLERLPGVASVAIERERSNRVFGEPALTYRVGEFHYQISPSSFFQSSRFLLPELVAAVTEESSTGAAAESDPRPLDPGKLALDLFAGVGLFTLPLARRFAQVVSVEAHPQASADLVANTRAYAMGNVRAVNESVYDFLRRCAQPEPDLVVLDPPREGVGVSSLKLLVALRPKRLHYVSCNPPTLARDLEFLIHQGYSLNSIELFDFFPQTYHIESLTVLSRERI
jgi:23S rRNA (uracil1939-C5)-methyltransferase